MRILRVALALTVALALVAVVSAAPSNAKGKGKGTKKGHGVHGVVEKVDNDGSNGTITVKVTAKKKGQAGTKTEKTFKITKATTFQKISGKKGDKQTSSASFGDVKKGEHIVIVAKDDVAEKVTIAGKGKKKSKGAKVNK